jgi:hypothetical protein
MATITELLAQVQANRHEVWTHGPQPEAAIITLESKLGVRLPPSYRSFLAQYGGMAIYNSTISGIIGGEPLDESGGSLYGDTLASRAEYGLPAHLLVIQPNDDAPYCLDTRSPSASGEFPVVCYERHSRHEGKIASDFEDWMRRFFLRWAVEKSPDP